jgi:hypothetical protein
VSLSTAYAIGDVFRIRQSLHRGGRDGRKGFLSRVLRDYCVCRRARFLTVEA